MIGTHAPKLLNPKVKQQALRARLDAGVPRRLICSRNVAMRREMWALPLNAAEMSVEREVIGTGLFSTDEILPSVTDGGVKQVLVPTGQVGTGEYACLAPVNSCGLLHEMWHRIREKNLPSWRWVVQPTPAAMANHGEQLLLQSGSLRLLRRGVWTLRDMKRPIKFSEDVVQLTGYVERMNIGSGALATGFPAMTAIGGMVHAIERECGIALDFAVGYGNVEFGISAKKIVEMRRGSIAASKAGTPGMLSDELTGDGRIVLLLKPAQSGADIQRVADAACTVRRVAGGALRDDRVDVLRSPGFANWISDAGHRAAWHLHGMSTELGRRADILDAALGMYGLSGEWVDGKWAQPRVGFTLNMTGYGYLGVPSPEAAWARQNYPAGWAEPLFSVVTQTRLPSWWSRSSKPWGVVWAASPRKARFSRPDLPSSRPAAS